MRIELPIAEALAFARSRTTIPPMLESIRSEGSAVAAVIDLRLVPSPSLAMKLLSAAAGRLTVTATFAGFTRGIVTFDVAANARGLPVEKLLSALLGRANRAIQKAGIPDGLVELTVGAGGAQLRINVQRAVSEKLTGLTVTGVDLRDGVLYLEMAAA